MKVLVTGATGFVGSHLCRRLADAGHDVIALRRQSSDRSRIADLNLEERIADIRDADTLTSATRGAEAVINAAASIAHWQAGSAGQHATNVDGVLNVARACSANGVRRLVHVSSVAAIGIRPRGAPPADESMQFNLESSNLPYHISKHRAEAAIQDEVARGLDAVIVNPGWIFGPHGTRYRG